MLTIIGFIRNAMISPQITGLSTFIRVPKTFAMASNLSMATISSTFAAITNAAYNATVLYFLLGTIFILPLRYAFMAFTYIYIFSIHLFRQKCNLFEKYFIFFTISSISAPAFVHIILKHSCPKGRNKLLTKHQKKNIMIGEI